MPTQLSLYVDWLSLVHGGLRPAIRPKNWATHSETLASILRTLREVVARQLAGRDVVVDTYLYGGFTKGDGQDSQEHVALTEAISLLSWSGRDDESRIRYRELTAVTHLLPSDPTTRVKALFRDRMRVPAVRLRVHGTPCSCDWLVLARQCFGSRDLPQNLRCPECRVTRVAVETKGQKLVDTLMVSHILYQAALLSHSNLSNPSEIWVFSDDVDALPAVCLANELGVPVTWLRSRKLAKYGYRELALNQGVEIGDLTR